MKLLITAATELELKDLLAKSTRLYPVGSIQSYLLNGQEFDVLITGIGMLNTVFALTNENLSEYDLIINAGIAGSFGKHQIGDVVLIEQDEIAWFGKEMNDGFVSASKLFKNQNLSDSEKPLSEGLEIIGNHNFALAKGITVNCVSGNSDTIEKTKAFYHPDTESMEGAAFYFVCNNKRINGIQIRSISNFVAPDTESCWDLELAVENLNVELENTIKMMKR